MSASDWYLRVHVSERASDVHICLSRPAGTGGLACRAMARQSTKFAGAAFKGYHNRHFQQCSADPQRYCLPSWPLPFDICLFPTSHVSYLQWLAFRVESVRFAARAIAPAVRTAYCIVQCVAIGVGAFERRWSSYTHWTRTDVRVSTTPATQRVYLWAGVILENRSMDAASIPPEAFYRLEWCVG